MMPVPPRSIRSIASGLAPPKSVVSVAWSRPAVGTTTMNRLHGAFASQWPGSHTGSSRPMVAVTRSPAVMVIAGALPDSIGPRNGPGAGAATGGGAAGVGEIGVSVEPHALIATAQATTDTTQHRLNG